MEAGKGGGEEAWNNDTQHSYIFIKICGQISTEPRDLSIPGIDHKQ
jgi:hypothetical protein